MGTILRTQNDTGTKYDLDLFNETDFLLDISAIESGDIGKVFGISSQTFALPPTKTNDEYFGNLYDLGASGEIAFTKTVPCQVINDGQAIFAGRLYLESVVTNTRGDTIYNVVVTNETVDFKYAIQDLTFGDLNWSEYNHNLTYANVSSSWGNTLFGGEIVYPLVEYGSKDKDVQASLLESGGTPNTFTNASSPLRLDQFKPAVRLRTVMDKIFETAGYTYTSSLFEDPYMDSVYVLATKDAEEGATTLNPISQSFYAYKAGPVQDQAFSGSYGVPFDVTFPTEEYDNANRFSNPTFTAAEDGQYSFSGQLATYFSTGSGNSFATATVKSIELDLYVNGAGGVVPTAYYNLNNYYDGQTATLNFNFANVQLAATDTVVLKATFFGGLTEILAFRGGIGANEKTTSYFQMYKGPQTLIGGNVNIGGSFMPEDSVLDFLNGVIQKFNLVIEPLSEEKKTLQVETFNDWVDKGKVVDWTDKVDRSVKWEITHPLQGQSRDLYFSDEEDDDSSNQYSINQLDKIYGDFTYRSESDLADGERRIGTYFAPTPMKYIEGTTSFIVPKIHTNNEGRKEAFSFKPRLLHYVEYKDVDDLQGKSGSLNTTNEWYFEDESGVLQVQEQYPVFHHNEALPADRTTTRDLHFGNRGHWSYHQSFVNAQTIRDAVYEYWSFYINELYDVDSRLLTCNVYLRPDEIGDIALNDSIFIDGHYYRINKISSADLTKPQSTKVELLKTLPRKSRFPRRRVYDPIDPTDYEDIYVGGGDVLVGGGVKYSYWDTDLPYTGSIVEAGNRDGFTVFSGSSEGSWLPNRTSIPASNRVVGSNYVDERVYHTDIIGSGNIVLGNIANSTVKGDNNTIQEATSDIHLFGNNILIGQSGTGSVEDAYIISPGTGSVTVSSGSNIIALNPVFPITEVDSGRTIIGNAVLQGSQFETYTNVPVSASAIVYLTGSAALDNFHHHFQWSGGNGSAIVFIEDNTDVTLDGVKARFTTDGNLTASKTVFLTPFPSGSIDGTAEITLSIPYDGLTLQVINGEWIVIQQKK